MTPKCNKIKGEVIFVSLECYVMFCRYLSYFFYSSYFKPVQSMTVLSTF